ncbi:TetR/AcrR family transcriptional regulator [Bacillus sp. FSL K6-6483]|uniref:TetR/AcrR family transcriptional regulator n=1 Tax=Shouchella clausii TaxID=79880 RepID=UPI000BA711AD|nr:TetR/AcrR family transcriptional regulator [Shouchella clausii]MCM3310971.1 TetR/AcrR family transcriptional regulator [Psychrobacillus sp. MER TA 17]PAF07645.1 hypothetical protein CHH65_19785 [Shouchella clausii]
MVKQADIMRAAFQLFSEKGYSATSVQEIVTICKMSKGTFYKHFSSKKELFFKLLEHRHFLTDSEEQAIEESGLEAKEKFLRKTELYMRSLYGNRNIYHLIPFVMEQEEFRELDEPIREYKIQSYHRLRQNIERAYSREFDHVWDLVLFYESAVKEYVEVGSHYEEELDFSHGAQMVVFYLDLLVKHGEVKQPLLSHRLMEPFCKYQPIQTRQMSAKEEVARFVTLLEQQIEDVPLSGTERDALRANIKLLKEELNQPEPRLMLIQTVLSLFQQNDAFKATVEAIATYLREGFK